jgi:hypothetical protein
MDGVSQDQIGRLKNLESCILVCTSSASPVWLWWLRIDALRISIFAIGLPLSFYFAALVGLIFMPISKQYRTHLPVRWVRWKSQSEVEDKVCVCSNK